MKLYELAGFTKEDIEKMKESNGGSNVMYISADLYKKLKDKNFEQERKIKEMKDSINLLNCIIEKQEQTIKYLEKIVNAFI